MKQSKLFRLIAAVSLSVIVVFFSCTKIDYTTVGSDLVPTVDNVNTRDTLLDVIANNFLFADSSTLTRSEQYALGTLSNDPIFGRTTSSIFVEFKPQVFNFYPFLGNKDSVIVDSVVLALGLTGHYGDTTKLQTVRVFEIAQAANFKDSSYLVRRPYTSMPLLGTALTPGPSYTYDPSSLRARRYAFRGSTKIDSFQNQLRIPLSAAFGARFKNYTTADAFKNDTLFRQNFMGFGIITDSTAGTPNSLQYFRFSENSGVYFYYRVTRNGKQDTLFTTFSYPFNCGHANIINRGYSGAEIASHLTPLPGGDNLLYLHSSPGTYAKLNIPGLTNLSNRVIHRAELIVREVPRNPLFKLEPVDYLFADVMDTINNKVRAVQPDFEYSAGTYNQFEFGMLGKKVTDPVTGFIAREWRLNFSRYVQNIVTRRLTNFPLRIYSPYYTLPQYFYPPPLSFEAPATIVVNPAIAYGGVRVGGGNNPAYKLQLRIIYSDIR